jgi:hypothetical protein
VQLAVAHIHAHHVHRALLQQAIGEATGALPDVQALPPGGVHATGQQRTSQLQAATRHVAAFAVIGQLQLGGIGHVIPSFGGFAPRRRRQRTPPDPLAHQACGLRSAGSEAALNEKLVDAHSAPTVAARTQQAAQPISSGRCRACKGRVLLTPM